jgi:hypothetical protein
LRRYRRKSIVRRLRRRLIPRGSGRWPRMSVRLSIRGFIPHIRRWPNIRFKRWRQRAKSAKTYKSPNPVQRRPERQAPSIRRPQRANIRRGANPLGQDHQRRPEPLQSQHPRHQARLARPPRITNLSNKKQHLREISQAALPLAQIPRLRIPRKPQQGARDGRRQRGQESITTTIVFSVETRI